MDKTRNRKHKRWILGSIAVVLAIATYQFIWGGQRTAQQMVAEAKASGFPVEQTNLFLDPPPNDHDNAALIFNQMIEEEPKATLATDRQDSSSFTRFVGGYGEYEDERVKSYLNDYQGLLDNAEKVAELFRCRYQLDWSNPFTVVELDSTALRITTVLLTGRAMVSLNEGDPEAALLDLDRIVRLSALVRQSGTVASHKVASEIEDLFFIHLQQLVSLQSVDESFLTALIEQMERWPDRHDLSQVLRHRAYIGVWIPRNADETAKHETVWYRWRDDYTERTSFLGKQYWAIPRVRAKAVRIALAYWQNVLDTYEEGPVDLLAWAEMMDRLQPGRDGKWSSAESLAVIPMMSLVDIVKDDMESQAIKTVIVSALRYIARTNGSTAEFLGDDPFTGRPLLHKSTQDGFKIYSVGKDAYDDGGYAILNAEQDYVDIVFNYTRRRSQTKNDTEILGFLP